MRHIVRSRRTSRQSGQASVEYVGTVAVVATLMAAAVAAATPAAGQVSAVVQDAICSVGVGGPVDCSTNEGSDDVDPSATVAASLADVARELGVPIGEVELVAVEDVTWNDGSLGCATSGANYTMALVPGQRMTVVVDGKTHYYHQGGSGGFFRCAAPTQS